MYIYIIPLATNNTIQIINLPKKTLTDAEQKLLEKG